MARQLDDLGLSHAFFEAVDASKGEHLKVSRYSPKRALWLRSRYMTPGEIGCFASHYLLWQRCAAGTEPMVIIEDDVSIEPGFARALGLAEETIGDLDFVRLAGLNDVPTVAIGPRRSGYRIVGLLKGASGTQCYAISPEGARKLLAKADRWIEPVDDYIDRFWTHGVRSTAILPFRIHQNDAEPSLIGEHRDKRQRSLIGWFGRTFSKLYGSIARRALNMRYVRASAGRTRKSGEI